jgi:hypothetical protein
VNLDSSSVKSPESDCSMECSGNGSEICGDANRLNVYSNPALADSTGKSLGQVGNFQYQSCWTDDVDARSLTGDTYRGDDMTVESCAAFCEGFAYFGVEYARECYCGNELTGQAAPEADCSELCIGNVTEWCGGPDRLNLYTTANQAVVSSSTTSTSASTSISSSFPSSTTSSTITTTAPQLTTVTNCPSTSTWVGSPTSCWAAVPSPCSSLNNPTLSWYMADDPVMECSEAFGYPLPTAVSSCLPMFLEPTNTPLSIYGCVASASLYCSYASQCTTNTYTVGQVPTATPAPNPNLIFNSGFETGDVSGWTFSNPLTPFQQSVTSSRAHTGTYSFLAAFENDNGHNTVLEQTLTVEPGATYTASFWWSQDNPSAYCGVSIYPSPYVPGSQTLISLTGTAAGQWSQVTTTWQNPTSYTTVGVEFYCNVGGSINSAAYKNNIYLDDISLTRVD